MEVAENVIYYPKPDNNGRDNFDFNRNVLT